MGEHKTAAILRGDGKASVEHQAFLAFHPGANAVMPQGGEGWPRVFQG